jgi:hypothetical protein
MSGCLLELLESRADELNRWIKHVPAMLRLFDDIQFSFPGLLGGKFGGIAEVRIFDERKYEKGSTKYRKTANKTAFLFRDMKYEYPTGWLYPVFAAFRVLLGPAKDGTEVSWKRDPFEFWKNHGSELCSRFEPHLKTAGYETKKVATSAITYSAVRAALTNLYQDDLLAEAGISA